jgi:AcrR family transcriptional regulator
MTTTPLDDASGGEESLAAQAVRRRLGDRQAAVEEEVRRLLDVGLRLMQEDPTGTPRIADIVRTAGVSNDAFYRAFRGKNDLMAAIADDGARRLLGYIRHQRDKADDPAGALRACVVAVLAQATDPLVAATTRAVLRNTSAASQPRSVGVPGVRERLAAEMVPPLRALGSADPDRDALVIACATFAVMEHHLWGEQVPADADVDHLVAFALRGLTRT